MIDEDVKNKANYGEFDRIAWPGASIDLENVKKAAEVSLRLHQPEEVTIYEHEDCGAYGEDNSFETHKQNAKKLEEALKSVNPNLNVTVKIATFEGVKEI